jgi:hypothetical protein
MDLGETGWGDMDSIGLAQDSVQWSALANEITFGFHKMLRIS